MDGDVKVSVIVPVYRVEKYVDRCMKSLTGQTLRETEIICICEQEDDSFKKLMEYAREDGRVKVIEKKNTGVSSARNAGMKAASGKYMAFVDADDWVERYALELLYKAAEKNRAQITAYGIWPTVEPEAEKRWIFDCTPDKSVVYHGNAMKALFYQNGSRPYVINKFYETRFLRQNGLYFNEELDIGEDQFFQFEAFSRAETVCFLKDKLYHYDITRKTSAMHQCERKGELEQKNFLLLKAVMERKRSHDEIKYNKEYVFWILRDFAGIISPDAGYVTDSKNTRRLAVRQYLTELDAEKHIPGLPREYRNLCRGCLDYPDGMKGYTDIGMPYKEMRGYAQKQTADIREKIAVPEKPGRLLLRRIHEARAFHELRHLAVKVLVRFGMY